MVWVLGGRGWGTVPVVEEGVAFRFAGRPAEVWRGQRLRSERWAGAPGAWVPVVSGSGARTAWLGERVAVRVVGDGPGTVAREIGERLGLRWVREGAGGIQILEARDPWSAALAAAALSDRPGMEVAVPVMRRSLALHRRYASRPNDPFFPEQWHLENRDGAGRIVGPDLHVRSGWAVAQGEGVTVAICDDGFETDHPDLRPAAVQAPHFDFVSGRTNLAVYGSHATSVAGLVAAAEGNALGVSGVAPRARLASWVIFDALGDITSDEALMDLFQNRIEDVAVQNHSWGNASSEVSRPTALEAAAISNAVSNGRGGRGVVMVRSGGNDRDRGSDVNDDAYASDPRVIAVAAVRKDGLTASYSNPGASLLVGAPSGDEDDFTSPTEGVATTDRVGTRGYNRVAGPDSRADYALRGSGFSGTSASAPQISGMAALVLSANPSLTVRDVQQVLIHASRHPAALDPDRVLNGAGYAVSHNLGFGVPDAGRAVRLAQAWTLRAPRVTETVGSEGGQTVPDAGARVWIRENGASERSILCEMAPGPHPDAPTLRLPLVHVGQATQALTVDLTGKAALIQRGGNTFREKLTFVAAAGARFGIFYNNTGGTTLDSPGFTDFVGIPSVFVAQDEGEALVATLDARGTVEAQVRLDSVARSFAVTRPMSCEHVGLRVRSNHARRGDLRITLVSPSGTRSVMQRRNFDIEPGPVDWTYWSTQHFYEPSVGTWRAEFTDQVAQVEGEILAVDLILWGVAMEDSDADGLDDGWERRWFGHLEAGPRDDPDRDGSSNAREQVLGTDPTQPDAPFAVALDPFDAKSVRLSWPATADFRYEVRRRGFPGTEDTVEAVLPGAFPELDWVVPSTSAPGALFQIERFER